MAISGTSSSTFRFLDECGEGSGVSRPAVIMALSSARVDVIIGACNNKLYEHQQICECFRHSMSGGSQPVPKSRRVVWFITVGVNWKAMLWLLR